jgi:hypothetical protein
MRAVLRGELSLPSSEHCRAAAERYTWTRSADVFEQTALELVAAPFQPAAQPQPVAMRGGRA